MKAFFLKYRRAIIFWVVFSAVVLYFGLGQHSHYLDSDIETFRKNYLAAFLVWTGVVISFFVFFVILLKTRSIIQSGFYLLITSAVLAFYFFIFQNIFLGASLFLNRQFKCGTLQKSYIANFMAGTEQTRNSFIPYDLSTNHSSTDQKLINGLYAPGIKQNDTVTLQFYKGLLGIPYPQKPFKD